MIRTERDAAQAVSEPSGRVDYRSVIRSRQRWLTLLIITLVLYTMRAFLAPVAWAAVLAISMWPLYMRTVTRAPSHRKLYAGLFSLATGLLVMMPLAIAATAAVQESQSALTWVEQVERTGLAAPAWLGSLPLIGPRALNFWQGHVGTPQAAANLLSGINASAILHYIRSIGAEAARGSIFFVLTLLILYVLLVHGDWLAAKSQALSRRAIGEFGQRFVASLTVTVRGTVTGTVLVAVGEGMLIGIGYWVAGVPQPLLFTIFTIFVAMLPSGAWFAFALATIILLIAGHAFAAVLLFGYSLAVMVVGDNVVQPAIIGNSVQLPFLLTLAGTFGGLQTFGLVGLFVGPALMAALLLVMQQLLAVNDGTALGSSST